MSIALIDKLQVFTLFLLWQGGGARISGGEVTFSSCSIYENTAAATVRAPPISPLGRWIGWAVGMGKLIRLTTCCTYIDRSMSRMWTFHWGDG